MQPTTLSYADLNAALLRAIPELRSSYEAAVTDWGPDSPGPHIVFEDLLVPLVSETIAADPRSHVLERAFAFVELMANQPDIHIVEVAVQSFLSRFCDPPASRSLHRLIGTRSRSLMDEYCREWHRH